MILVMNKKHGVGCTLLAYNIGRLFNLSIYVDKDSFMLDDEHKALFPNVSKITVGQKHGVFDIGANFETKYAKKFIRSAKLIAIPFEYGYESMIQTIQTLKFIEFASSRKIPILLILNRLDKHDSDRDFNYTRHMKDKFSEEGYNFRNIYDPNDDSNIYLAYLRNSYSLQSNLEAGEYFLDKMYNQDFIYNELNNLQEFRTNIKDFEYKFFLYLARSIIDQVDYENEEVYRQDKDMVMFRNNYRNDYIAREYEDSNSNLESSLKYSLNKYFENNKGLARSVSLQHLVSNVYVKNKETKLLKDMAYIGYIVDVLYRDL